MILPVFRGTAKPGTGRFSPQPALGKSSFGCIRIEKSLFISRVGKSGQEKEKSADQEQIKIVARRKQRLREEEAGRCPEEEPGLVCKLWFTEGRSQEG